jgi:hypothetical protein
MANGQSGKDVKPYSEGTGLCAAVVLPPSSLGEDFWCMNREGAHDIYFWAAVPLHMAELEFRFEHGIDPLLELFDKSGVTDRIVPERPSVV